MYLFSDAKKGIDGSVAEWSKALVSNPTAAIYFFL